MKQLKTLSIILSLLLLTGCGKQTFEQVNDGIEVGATVPAGQISLELPSEFVMPAMEHSDGSKLYLWEDYSLILQTLDSGDLDRTLRTCTGFGREELTVLHTQQGQLDSYVCAWTSAGEGSDQVGRLAVLDDGHYHYTMCLMAPVGQAEDAGALWRGLQASFNVNSVP